MRGDCCCELMHSHPSTAVCAFDRCPNDGHLARRLSRRHACSDALTHHHPICLRSHAALAAMATQLGSWPNGRAVQKYEHEPAALLEFCGKGFGRKGFRADLRVERGREVFLHSQRNQDGHSC